MLKFRAERLGCDLGRHAYLASGGISGDKPDFVDANRRALAVSEGTLDLFDHILGPGSAHGEGSHQLDKLFLGDLIGEVDAGQAGSGQQLREAAFGLAGLQRSAIEQKFILRDTEQEGAVRSLGQALLQLVPCSCKLSLGALVLEAVQANVLHQYVQTVYERSGRGYPAAVVCVCRYDGAAPGKSGLPRKGNAEA